MSESEIVKKNSRREMIELLVDNLIEDLPRILSIPVEKEADEKERQIVKRELREKMIEILILLLEKDDE